MTAIYLDFSKLENFSKISKLGGDTFWYSPSSPEMKNWISAKNLCKTKYQNFLVLPNFYKLNLKLNNAWLNTYIFISFNNKNQFLCLTYHDMLSTCSITHQSMPSPCSCLTKKCPLKGDEVINLWNTITHTHTYIHTAAAEILY